MRQAGILAGAGLYALKHNITRLADDHRRERKLAEAIEKITGVRIDLGSVQTNIVVFDVSGTGLSPEAAAGRLVKKRVRLVPFGRTKLRAVTHLDVGDQDIDEAAEIIRRCLRGGIVK